MKKSLVYTRGGDKGMTSLVGGQRVKKQDIRLEAYGMVDELNAQLGLLATYLTDEDLNFIRWIQHKLFSVGSYLATPSVNEEPVKCWIGEKEVLKLEKTIDEMDSLLSPLTGFVLPGGSRAAAVCHVCRTVCRRTERAILRFSETAPVDALLLAFMNRLSDFLFVFSRYLNKKQDNDEIFWQKDCD